MARQRTEVPASSSGVAVAPSERAAKSTEFPVAIVVGTQQRERR